MIFWYCGKMGGGVSFKSFALVKIHVGIHDYFLLNGENRSGKIQPVPGCTRGMETTFKGDKMPLYAYLI